MSIFLRFRTFVHQTRRTIGTHYYYYYHRYYSKNVLFSSCSCRVVSERVLIRRGFRCFAVAERNSESVVIFFFKNVMQVRSLHARSSAAAGVSRVDGMDFSNRTAVYEANKATVYSRSRPAVSAFKLLGKLPRGMRTLSSFNYAAVFDARHRRRACAARHPKLLSRA